MWLINGPMRKVLITVESSYWILHYLFNYQLNIWGHAWRHSETSILNLREHDPVREGFRTLQGFDKGLFLNFREIRERNRQRLLWKKSTNGWPILIWGIPGIPGIQPVKIDVWCFDFLEIFPQNLSTTNTWTESPAFLSIHWPHHDDMSSHRQVTRCRTGLNVLGFFSPQKKTPAVSVPGQSVNNCASPDDTFPMDPWTGIHDIGPWVCSSRPSINCSDCV